MTLLSFVRETSALEAGFESIPILVLFLSDGRELSFLTELLSSNTEIFLSGSNNILFPEILFWCHVFSYAKQFFQIFLCSNSLPMYRNEEILASFFRRFMVDFPIILQLFPVPIGIASFHTICYVIQGCFYCLVLCDTMYLMNIVYYTLLYNARVFEKFFSFPLYFPWCC